MSIKKECPICGKVFETYPSVNKITCSKKCSSERLKETMKGENNPNFGNRWTDEQRRCFSDYQKSIGDVISARVKSDWEDNDERKKKTSELQSKLAKERIGEKNPFYGKKHSDETKNKIKRTFEDIGRRMPDENKSDYRIYYEESNWIEKMFDKVENGLELLNEHGIFNSKSNSNGVVRDHIIGKRYGFNNRIFPEILRHPCNCQIITNAENISKAHKFKKGSKINECHMSLVELFERIKNFNGMWLEQELVEELIKNYLNGHRWVRKEVV